MSIAENLGIVLDRIERAAKKSGRLADDVTLVAVTKTIPTETIEEAIEAGIRHIGENRVQEAGEKFRLLERHPIQRHLIGHLQRNKAKSVIPMFDLIQSIDSTRLLESLEKHAAQMNRVVDALIQVNTSAEATKFGIAPDEARALVARAADSEHIRVRGLMTIGPLVGGPEAARASFRQLRGIRDELVRAAIPGVQMEFLSMGMTGDFEVAIEEGANMVRIGTAIFGRRDG